MDLDGHVDLASSPVRGGIRIEGDRLGLSGAPGLGIELEQDWVDRFAGVATLPAGR